MQLFNKELKLAILDVDGVILDLVACFQPNLEAAARSFGLSIEPIKDYLGAVYAGQTRGYPTFEACIASLWPHLTPEQIVQFELAFRDQERQNPYPPIEGSIDTIHWLIKNGVDVAICTTNPRKVFLERFKNAGINILWFAASVTKDDEYVKPDPRALDYIFDTVQIHKENTVYIGDWYPDLEMARAAHVRFLAALSGGIPREAFLREGTPEDHILDRLADLKKLVT